jgi:hypothetical protein
VGVGGTTGATGNVGSAVGGETGSAGFTGSTVSVTR